MSLISSPRDCAPQRLGLAECLSSKEQETALERAEARSQLAMDAATPESGDERSSAIRPQNVHQAGRSMSERATTRMFGLSLGGILFATLVLHAVLR
jgi:hypothetical protein